MAKRTLKTEPPVGFATGPADDDAGPGGDVGLLAAEPAEQGGGLFDAPAAPKKKRRQMTPAQLALSLLVRREHSRPELLRKLTARGVEMEEAEAAVERMAEAGWQDDGRFAASLARSRALAGYGPLRIEAELGMHQLEAAHIQAAFETLEADGEADWSARAFDLIERRFNAQAFAEDQALQRKAADFLLRRGFDGSTAWAAVRELRESGGERG